MYGLVELPAYPLCIYFINKPWFCNERQLFGFNGKADGQRRLQHCVRVHIRALSHCYQKVLHASMPFMVFCLIGVSAGALGLLLPETLNKPVAETLEELSSPVYQRILDTQVHLLEDENLSKHSGSESD